MKKYSLLFGFLFASIRLFAVTPVPFTEIVSFSFKITTSGTGTMTVTDDTGSPAITYGGTAESDTETAALRPGRRYDLTFSTTAAATYSMGFISPAGYVLLIDDQPTNLVSGSLSGSGSQPYHVELRPVASYNADILGSFSGIDLGSSINWSVGLGKLHDGRSAGRITFREKDLTNSPGSRDRLYYGVVGNYGEINVTYDGTPATTLSQVSVPQGLVDIVNSTNGYTFKFYAPSQTSPWKTIQVQFTGGNVLTLTETEGSTIRVSELTVSGSGGDYTWTLKEGTTSTKLRTTVHTSTNHPGATPTPYREVVAEVHTGDSTASGTLVGKTKFHYENAGWGEDLIKILAYPESTTTDANALTTTYAYHEVAPTSGSDAERGNYRRVKSITDPTGRWTAWRYYDDWDRRGQLAYEFHPFMDSPSSAPNVNSASATATAAASGRVVYYEYAADWTGRYNRPTLRQEKINNVTTGQTTWTPGDTTGSGGPREYFTIYSFDGSGYKTDYTERYRGDIDLENPFKPYFDSGADLAATSSSHGYGALNTSTGDFTYNSDNSYYRDLKVHGSTSNAVGTSVSAFGGQPFHSLYLIPNKSTVDAAVRDFAGNVVRTETWVYTGSTNFARMTWETFTYDAAGRLTQRVASDTATVDSHYTDGRLDYTVDVAGTRAEFAYDELGRVHTSVKKGLTVSGYTLPGDITTTYTYDGANHVTQTQVAGSTHTLTSTAQFDLAGRLTQQIQFSGSSTNSLTTGYTYSSGGKIVTATLPGSATQITEEYLDGQSKSVTGTALVNEFMSYTRDGTSGYRKSEHRFASTSSLTLTTTTNDWLGRKLSFEQPSPTGTGTTTQSWHYNGYGQPDKFSQPGPSTGTLDTLYEYDTLGQQSAQGLDVNGNGTLNRDTSDRITEQTYGIYSWDGGTSWWREIYTLTYATSGSSAQTFTNTDYERLSGFSSGIQRTKYLYDINGNKTTITTAVDRTNKTVTTTTYAPDSSTNAVQVAYNGFLASVTDTVGHNTKYGYDDIGRQTLSIDSRTSGTTTTAYISGTNLIYTVTDPASVVQATYTYDGAGRVSSVKNGLTKFAYFDYNARSQKTREWGQTTHPVEYYYDPYGRQTAMRTFADNSEGQSGGSEIDFTGAGGWPTAYAGNDLNDNPSTPPAKGNRTLWVFQEATGLLSSKTDAAGHSVSYSYNAAGQVATVTNARSIVTTNTYSSTTGELTGVTYSDSTPSPSYAYNRLGQLYTVADYTGTRTFTYNLGGTLELQNEQLGSAFHGNYQITRGYDTTTGAVGRYNQLSVGTSSNHTLYYNIYYSYDSSGRLNQTWNFPYTYVTNSRLINTVSDYTSNWTQTRTYVSNRDLLASIETKWSGTSEAKFAYSAQDNLGRVTDVTKTGAMFDIYDAASTKGLKTTYGYNDRSEIISDTTNDLASTPAQINGRQDAYTYDNMGNRHTVTKTRPTGDPGGDQSIDYSPTASPVNNLNQYTRRNVPGIFDVAASSSTASTITVDGGNMAKQGKYFFRGHPLTNSSGPVYSSLTVAPSGGTSYSLDAFLPMTTEDFTYDNDGNLTQDGRWVYQYDALNRLIAMFTRGAPEDPNASVSANAAVWNSGVPVRQKLTFAYDYADRRVQKKEYTWNSSGSTWYSPIESRFVYDGFNLLFELDGSMSAKALYVWGLDLSGTLQGAGGVGGLLCWYDFAGGDLYSPAYDGNGNVAAMIKTSDGSIAGAYEYDAFGHTLRESGPYAAPNPFRYSTKYTDIETGLVYYGQRYYSPSLGRFINRDPIEEAGGLNLYSFCGNNGVNGIDILGMWPRWQLDDPGGASPDGDDGWDYHNGSGHWIDGTPADSKPAIHETADLNGNGDPFDNLFRYGDPQGITQTVGLMDWTTGSTLTINIHNASSADMYQANQAMANTVATFDYNRNVFAANVANIAAVLAAQAPNSAATAQFASEKRTQSPVVFLIENERAADKDFNDKKNTLGNYVSKQIAVLNKQLRPDGPVNYITVATFGSLTELEARSYGYSWGFVELHGGYSEGEFTGKVKIGGQGVPVADFMNVLDSIRGQGTWLDPFYCNGKTMDDIKQTLQEFRNKLEQTGAINPSPTF